MQTQSLFHEAFYRSQSHYSGSDPLAHYRDIGAKVGFLPNPFLLPKLFRALYGDVFDEIADASFLPLKPHMGALGPFFDPVFAAAQNGVTRQEAEAFVCDRIAENSWADFHPLLSRTDYAASKAPGIAAWLEELSDPDRSLADRSFAHFSPRFYRQTAGALQFENEMLDYLVNGQTSQGIPHPFCDYWYSEQFTSERALSWDHGDSWLNMLADFSKFGPHVSPFFDPFWFNHEISERYDKTEDHPLSRFAAQTKNPLPPHRNVVPSALAFAFLGHALPDCAPDRLDAGVVVEAVETALRGTRPAPGRVRLSICILNYNKPAHTILSSIAAATHAPADAEILVLDNGSQPKDFEVILRHTRGYENIRVIRSNTNLYFGEGNNVLLDQARGEYILFLNNDAYVGPTTLQTMIGHLDTHPEVAASGVTFLFPDLSVQEAGGLISDCGQQVQMRKHTELDAQLRHAAARVPESTQYISSACFCVRRAVLDELGAYDLIFEPLYFEDSDLCKRITSAGYRIDHLPWDHVIHFENASTREFLGKGFMDQIRRNREKFRDRWLYQPQGHRPRAMAPAVLRKPDPKRPSALIYSPFGLAIGGGERYLMSVAAALADRFNVTVSSNRMLSRTRLAYVLDDLGIAVDDKAILIPQSFEAALTAGPPDLMFAMGNEAIPPVPMVGRKNLFHCQFPFPGHHEDRTQTDRYRTVDAVLVNSGFTKTHMQAQLDILGVTCPVHVTYAPVAMSPAPSETGAAAPGKLRLVNVGRFDPHGHAKRQDIVLDILLGAQAAGLEAELTLIGSCDASEVRQAYLKALQDKAQDLDVRFMVNAARPKLEAALLGADVYVHACGFGASVIGAPERQEHFGISVIEGMSSGLVPVVYSEGGPAETVREGGVGYTYASVAEAVAALRDIAALPPEDRLQVRSGARRVAERFSERRFRDEINRLVDGLMADRSAA